MTTITAPTYTRCPTCGGPTQPDAPGGMCPGCITVIGFRTAADSEPGATQWEQGRDPFTDADRAVIRHYELAINHIPDGLACNFGIVHGEPAEQLHAAYRNPPAGVTTREAIRGDLQYVAEWEQALGPLADHLDADGHSAAFCAYRRDQIDRYQDVAHTVKDIALACLLGDPNESANV
jgi:hypothetical protein